MNSSNPHNNAAEQPDNGRTAVRRSLALPSYLELPSGEVEVISADILNFSREGLGLSVKQQMPNVLSGQSLNISFDYYDERYILNGVLAWQAGLTSGFRIINGDPEAFEALMKLAKIQDRNNRYEMRSENLVLCSESHASEECDQVFQYIHELAVGFTGRVLDNFVQQGKKFLTLNASASGDPEYHRALANSIDAFPTWVSLVSGAVSSNFENLKERLIEKDLSSGGGSSGSNLFLQSNNVFLEFSNSNQLQMDDVVYNNLMSRIDIGLSSMLNEIQIRLSHILGREISDKAFRELVSPEYFARMLADQYRLLKCSERVDEIWSKLIAMHFILGLQKFYKPLCERMMALVSMDEIKRSPVWQKKVVSSIESIFESAR